MSGVTYVGLVRKYETGKVVRLGERGTGRIEATSVGGDTSGMTRPCIRIVGRITTGRDKGKRFDEVRYS